MARKEDKSQMVFESEKGEVREQRRIPSWEKRKHQRQWRGKESRERF
jgi:hypothetical protein